MSPYDYVNTKMGTFNSQRYSNGNCYPICAVPRGMNFFTLQTKGGSNWFYSPYEPSFEGIRLTHQPSPWLSDYGNVLMWADRGEAPHSPYWSSYDIKNSVFEPAYISLFVQRDRYSLELAPTNSCAALRFCFNSEGGVKRILFSCKNLKYFFNKNTCQINISTFDINPATKVELTEYIVIKADSLFDAEEVRDAIALRFDNDEINLKVATSYISYEQAELNLAREIGSKTLEALRKESTAIWNNTLSKITVEDRDEERKATFYSCFYRFNLWPTKFYELDTEGKPIHVNTHTGGVAKGYLYTNNGFWDTFRTVYPLLSILDRDLYAEIAEGFYNYYVDTGWLPKWVCPYNFNCMPGMLVEATMSDAIVKEIVKGELAENIFQAMLKDGEHDSKIKGVGRTDLTLYRKLGYLPYTVLESVNETLDNSFGDFAIAKAAEKLGYTDIAKKYFEYSKNYRNLFDKKAGFIRGKDENGNFRDEEFDPYLWCCDYTEGSAWQNAFGVYHDIKGLDLLYEAKLSEKIDELMSAPPIYRTKHSAGMIHEMSELAAKEYGQCAISNQPSFHIPYIYGALGETAKTAYHVEKLSRLFNSSPEGYPGDEDNGSMSAWYILSCLGLYQMAPSDPCYITSLPLFDKITVKLSGGNRLEIEKEDFDVTNMKSMVSYDDVMLGGNLWQTLKK